MPHGLIVSYTEDGSPVAALGGSFGPASEKKDRFVRPMHRMVKQEQGEGATSRFRVLPLHLAMEGFLALHFNGPDILWNEYSQQAISRGLDPRSERAIRGSWLPGLEEALRTFEILPAQVGVLVFVADALACALVMPHPDDYRRMHTSLLGSAGLLGRAVKVERVRATGPFRLERFVPLFDPDVECHIGERIVRDDGTSNT